MQNHNTSGKETDKKQEKPRLPGAEYMRQLYEAAKRDGRTHSAQSGKCKITIRVL